MSHTPGPWRFDKEYGNSMDELYGPDGRAIAAIWTRRCHSPTHVRECYKPDAEGQANARLIAAAPELLEACKSIQRSIDEFVMGEWESSEEAWNALSDRLQSAIAKATAQ